MVNPQLLHKRVGSSNCENDNPSKSLRLLMLGCEDNPPYGPTEHTAQLFLDLFSQTIAECSSDCWSISIVIYRVQQGHYPSDWDSYDGILLTGSFSAAYDNDPWIEKLKQVIQTELVAKQRPTLGVCFGHQILAHSFEEGTAEKYENGSRAGRFPLSLTKAGQSLFGSTTMDLFYTHGDMVQKLPPCAVVLGHEGGDLPVQSAAYFQNQEKAHQFLSNPSSVRPYAITFQAHPEYAVSQELGLKTTLGRILDLMADKGLVDSKVSEKARQDATEQFEKVQRQSKDALIASARALGWLP